jgi:hypothetical protein
VRRVLVTLALLAACTSGNFPAIDQVLGLTVMAIKADPPDQLVIVDGGIFALVVGDGGNSVAAISPVTLTALVADPGGNGRAVQTVFATCAALDATTHQCLPTSPDYQVIGSGAYFPDAGPAIIANAAFTPGQQLLGDALGLDPDHGFGYLPLHVQVTVNAGSDQVVATKTLTFSQPITVTLGELGGPPDSGIAVTQPADLNPVMPVITLDGFPWEPAGAPLFVVNDTTIEPTPQTSEVSYFVPQFDGGLIPFTDFYGYEFYCTAGTFSNPRSGGGPRPGGSFSFGRGDHDAGAPVFDDAGETIPGTSVTWDADAGTPAQLVYYWIVVLDGRGGVDFTQRTAQFEGE